MSDFINAQGQVTPAALVTGYSWIVRTPGYLAGHPAILGRRITVEFILQCLGQGLSAQEFAEDYEVPLEAVQEAIRFSVECVSKRALS